MNYSTFSLVCGHPRTERIDNDFVRCLYCKQSFVQQRKKPVNRTQHDFIKEDSSFMKNFDRNFSNIVENTTVPKLEYYTDRMAMNTIMINRVNKYRSQPIKFDVVVNGERALLTDKQISKLLTDIYAVRIDKDQYQQLVKQGPKVENQIPF